MRYTLIIANSTKAQGIVLTPVASQVTGPGEISSYRGRNSFWAGEIKLQAMVTFDFPVSKNFSWGIAPALLATGLIILLGMFVCTHP